MAPAPPSYRGKSKVEKKELQELPEELKAYMEARWNACNEKNKIATETKRLKLRAIKRAISNATGLGVPSNTLVDLPFMAAVEKYAADVKANTDATGEMKLRADTLLQITKRYFCENPELVATYTKLTEEDKEMRNIRLRNAFEAAKDFAKHRCTSDIQLAQMSVPPTLPPPPTPPPPTLLAPPPTLLAPPPTLLAPPPPPPPRILSELFNVQCPMAAADSQLVAGEYDDDIEIDTSDLQLFAQEPAPEAFAPAPAPVQVADPMLALDCTLSELAPLPPHRLTPPEVLAVKRYIAEVGGTVPDDIVTSLKEALDSPLTDTELKTLWAEFWKDVEADTHTIHPNKGQRKPGKSRTSGNKRQRTSTA